MTDGRGGVTDPLLSVENLRTTFETDQETVRAVDGVSVAVAPRQTLGIVGESGSGKSVSARSILGLIDGAGRVHGESTIRYHDPSFVERMARDHPKSVKWADEAGETGEVVEEGSSGATTPGSDAFVTIESGTHDGGTVSVDAGWVDLVAAPEAVVEAVRGSEIAMVFQDALGSLNPVYTVGNQIRELLRIHRGLTGREAVETAADLLESVGIPDPKRRLGEYPHQFSGGMQQRAVIALALACDPNVLLCDEPTTALDVTIQAQILDLLAELQHAREMSMLFITHDLGVVAEVADRVVVMYAGKVMERGPVARVLSDPAHPYTRALLRCLPGGRTGGETGGIPGDLPDPRSPSPGCRFEPRCPHAVDACAVGDQPPFYDVGGVDGDAIDSDADARHVASCVHYDRDRHDSESSRSTDHATTGSSQSMTSSRSTGTGGDGS